MMSSIRHVTGKPTVRKGTEFVGYIKTKKSLTLAGADTIARAAEAEALKRGARVVIAVVDDAGKPIVLRRLDGTQVASVDVAVDKARTAAIFRRPSRDIEQQVHDGRFGALQLHGAVALQGGIPLAASGDIVGAIGVSGETPAEDEAVAIAGAQAIAS
jgi:glc operon protein GlcG